MVSKIGFDLVYFYGISTIEGYLIPNTFYTYTLNMFSKHILKITSFNKPELIFWHIVKWLYLFQSNTNNSIYYELFVCTQFNPLKYCYILLTIQLNISHLFTHS